MKRIRPRRGSVSPGMLIGGIAPLILFASCQSAVDPRQAFVDQALGWMEKLDPKPTLIQRADRAGEAYGRSGFTDLASAEVVRSSYQSIVENAMQIKENALDLEVPDEEAAAFTREFSRGLTDFIAGNQHFAKSYSDLDKKTIAQRNGAVRNVGPGMSRIGDGLAIMIGSLERLKAYVEKYQLEGADTIAKRLARAREELQMARRYSSR